MSFLTPAFLMALPLIAVPIIIHFFARRQREVIRWGAMDFLLGSAIPRRRFLRLRDLLLMLLRALILLAIVAALAQPLISSSRFGSGGPRDVILIFDNSMSTGRELSGKTIFQEQLVRAESFLDRLQGSDTIRVMITSPRPEWLTDRALTVDASSRNEILTRLREHPPGEGAADIPVCVQEALAANPAARNVSKRIHVISDGQAASWNADVTNGWAAIRTFTAKARPPAAVSAELVGAGSDYANLTVERITAPRGIVAEGQPVTLSAHVRNTGTTRGEGQSVAWSAGGRSLGLTPLPFLEPGAATVVRISQTFSTPGVMDIECRVQGADALSADNAARFLLDVSSAVRVLVVEGEPRSEVVESDTHYFLAALGQGSGRRATPRPNLFQPRLIGHQDLARESLDGIQCVVLAGVSRLSASDIRKLSSHVQAGGGLWIAPGEQTDVAEFNRMFMNQAAPLSPAALLEATGDAGNREEFVSIVPPASDHPATALLSDIQRVDLDKVRVYRRHGFDSAGQGQGEDARLLRVEGGAALALEKQIGRGRVIAQAIPLGLAWSSFPLCQAYVVMVNEWLWYLSEPGLTKRNLRAGEAFTLAQPANRTSGIGWLETPDGRNVQVIGDEDGGRVVFRYARTLIPGEYRFRSADAPGAPIEDRFIVQRDPEESNLTPLSTEQMEQIAAVGGLEFTAELKPSDPGTAAPSVSEPGKPIAFVLLGVVVGLLGTEVLMAFWLARKRRLSTSGAVMQPGGAV